MYSPIIYVHLKISDIKLAAFLYNFHSSTERPFIRVLSLTTSVNFDFIGGKQSYILSKYNKDVIVRNESVKS